MNRNHHQCKDHPRWIEAQQCKQIRLQNEYKSRIEVYNSKPNTCKQCLKPLTYKERKNSFCSRSCSASFNNSKRAKQMNVCLYCKDTFHGRYKSYCSRRCSSNHKIILTFESNELKRSVSRPGQKNFLLLTTGHSCSVCNNTEWNGEPIPLEVDHVDGNATNNLRDNLRLICPNCHAQTSTYKGKNRGNGRKYHGLKQR